MAEEGEVDRFSGSYALVQFSPVPERMEFLNVGVVLIVPGLQFVQAKFADNNSRIEKLSGKPSGLYLEALKVGLPRRLRWEFNRANMRGIEEYSQKRANDIRITSLQSIAVSDPEEALERLFVELVGDREIKHRRPQIRSRLKSAFREARILEFMQEKPAPVKIPEAGIEISAPFGYQNGSFNLVDGMNLGGDRREAVKEAGRRAFEGRILEKHYEGALEKSRLVIVGDFHDQPSEFYEAVAEQFGESGVRLYRIDHLGPLIDDIKNNASLH